MTILGASRREPAVWSRGCRAALLPGLHGPGLIDALLGWPSFHDDPVLFLTDEMAVFTISERRRALEGSYRFALPSPEMVTALSDKAAFHALAKAHGLPAPRSAVLESAAVCSKLQGLALPVIIKPSDKRAVHAGRAVRIQRAESRAEAERACRDMMRHAGAVIAQEWIPGADSDIVFCLFYAGRDGEIVSAFTGRSCATRPGSAARDFASPPPRPSRPWRR